MTGREQGYLLLTNRLGDPACKPLSLSQLDRLGQAVHAAPAPTQDRAVTCDDLLKMGLEMDFAVQILSLLNRKEQLKQYLKKAKAAGCYPLTRISDGYPVRLLQRLGADAPAVLWCKGDLKLLQRRSVGVVGSRDLQIENYCFANEVGRQAAKQGFAVVSGNARGADSAAQDGCLTNRGFVVSILPDELSKQPAARRVLYLSEDGFDVGFSSYRALRRNRIIHGLGEKTFVAQCAYGRSGTWDGTRNNLRNKLSPVYCFRDGSPAARELEQLGARLIGREDLADLQNL